MKIDEYDPDIHPNRWKWYVVAAVAALVLIPPVIVYSKDSRPTSVGHK